MVVGLHPIQLGYVLLFGVTALVCFGAIARTRDRLDDPDTRWGLTTLLATCGLWASFHVGRIVTSDTTLTLVFYVLGLVVGLATVGAWLYFCSAYAGESYHRQARYRWLALGVFAAIVAVKLTSPIHGLYFSTTTATTPFPHLVIELGVLHWIVTGLAYALSAVGFYMLFDLFQNSNYATTRLGFLVALAGFPVVFDLLGYLSPSVILKLKYEPVGVALFALGVLYVADGSFVAVQQFGREQLLDELSEAVVLIDDDGVVRELNDTARRLFPALTDGIGKPLVAAVPEVDRYLPADGSQIIEFDDAEPSRYYVLSTSELTVGQTTIGQTLVFTDVTEVERQRQEVQHHQAQLDDFAEAVTHELRNTLNIAQGNADLVGTRLDPGTDTTAHERLTTLSQTHDRMLTIVDDLAALARFGQPVENPTPTDVAATANEAWASVTTDGTRLSIDADGSIEADPSRLRRLFENLFEFAIANGATQIELTQTSDGLVVTDDGTPVREADVEDVLTYGQAVPDAESGLLLPVVRTLAEAHGWTVTIETEYRDGVQIRITQ